MSDNAPTKVDFWFDPSCPWAWMTSRWIGEVQKHRPLDVQWRVMSLAILNEDKETSEGYRDFLPRALRLTRLVSGVAERDGQELVKPLYDALGMRLHPGARTDLDAIIAEALQEIGVAPDRADFADSDEFDGPMRASHELALEKVGDDVGTPVIAVDGTAFFGPVVSPAPTGDEAVRLWDGVVAAASYPGFFELKRSRTVGPQFG